jgi:HK97 family phage major capsid protein
MGGTNMKYEELIDARNKIVEDQRAMLDEAESEGRELNTEEVEQYEKMDTDFDTFSEEIVAEDARREQAAKRVAKLVEREADLEKVTNNPLKPEPESREVKVEKTERKRITDTDEYRSAFVSFLRMEGFSPEEAAAVNEARALQLDTDVKGGYLVAPEDFRAELIKELDNMLFVRQFCKKISVPGPVPIGVPKLDNDPGTYALGWNYGEITAAAEDSTMDIDKRVMTPHPLKRLLKVSDTLIRTATIDIEGLVRERLAFVFGEVEEYAYLNGDGANEPLGLLTASAAGINTGRDTTASSTTAVTSDEMIDVVYSVKAQYRRNARWIVGRTAMREFRQLKTGEGQYIWQPGMVGEPATFLGYPIHESEYMPAFSSGNYVALFGDLSKYWIVESLNFQIKVLNELYSANDQIGYRARREVDGAPVDENAFARIALA